MGEAESRVTGIIRALSVLEDDIDSLNSRTPEAQKAISSRAQSELASLRERTRKMAAAEAESIMGAARTRAEAEAARIAQEGASRISAIQSRINDGFDEAVDIVASAVLKG